MITIVIVWALMFIAVDKSPLPPPTEQSVFAAGCDRAGGIVLMHPDWNMPECWIDK